MSDLKKFDDSEKKLVRFFAGDRAHRHEYLKQFPGRWENDSAFIRAACQHFMRTLDKERDEQERNARRNKTKVTR